MTTGQAYLMFHTQHIQVTCWRKINVFFIPRNKQNLASHHVHVMCICEVNRILCINTMTSEISKTVYSKFGRCFEQIVVIIYGLVTIITIISSACYTARISWTAIFFNIVNFIEQNRVHIDFAVIYEKIIFKHIIMYVVCHCRHMASYGRRLTVAQGRWWRSRRFSMHSGTRQMLRYIMYQSVSLYWQPMKIRV